MRVCVIVCAAGASRRFGGRDKLAADLGGKTVLQRSVELFRARPEVEWVLVAGPRDDEAFEAFGARFGDMLALLGATLVRGGAEHRWQTVQAALQQAPQEATHIAVHDAARPGAPAAMLDRLFRAAASCQAVVPGLPVADTLKRVAKAPATLEEPDPLRAALLGDAAATEQVWTVEATLDRQGLFAVQTPQVFAAPLLRRAYDQEDLTSTDDASLVERLGEQVRVVEGDPRAWKITRPEDLETLRALLGLAPPKSRAAHKRF